MKKIALVLAVLLFTAPAMAALSVSCAESGGTVTVSYNAGGGTLARGFALDLKLSNTATITSTPPADPNAAYYIYPGSITISGGAVTGWGTPVASSDANSMTIEMGSLYATNASPPHNVPPGNSGTLFSFGVSGTGTVTITENSGRAGVVMEDGSANGLGSPVCTCAVPGDCLIGGNAFAGEYNKWVTYGKPACWCYRRQCRGDATGSDEFFKPVMAGDLTIWKAAYNQSPAVVQGIPNGICADFDHKDEFFKPVMAGDLTIWKAYYNVAKASVPECDAAPVITGPYNFWTN